MTIPTRPAAHPRWRGIARDLGRATRWASDQLVSLRTTAQTIRDDLRDPTEAPRAPDLRYEGDHTEEGLQATDPTTVGIARLARMLGARGRSNWADLATNSAFWELIEVLHGLRPRTDASSCTLEYHPDQSRPSPTNQTDQERKS